MAGRMMLTPRWTPRDARLNYLRRCRRLNASLHNGQPSRVTLHHHEFATRLSQRCARCQPHSHSAAQFMKLFEMVELCLRSNGERLDARISREFREFDHLATPHVGPEQLPINHVDESLPEEPDLASTQRPDELEQTSSTPAANRLRGLALTTKYAVERAVAPLLKRQAERERIWLAAKAIETQQWRQEHHLLSLYCHLLHLSGFHLCSQAHADEHAAMQSSMGIGVRVDWSSLDSGMLSRFDAYGPLSPYNGVRPPKAVFDNKRVLIAVKGHVVLERKAFFFADKLDELLRRAYLRILRAGLARVADPSWVQELSGERHGTCTNALPNGVHTTSSRAPCVASALGSLSEIENGSSSSACSAPASSRYTLDRLTVRDLRLNVMELLSRSTLREPCYSDVLVLFRRRAQWDTDDATLNPRNIYLRHYRRVPLADLTLLMPDKRPAMRAVDRLTCGSYSLTAALAAVPLLSSAHMLPLMDSPLFPYSAVEPLSWTWILAASTFTAAASKVLFRYRMTKSYYHEAVNSHAARNSANSDGGVLSFLIEHASEEQFKRAVAVYTALAVANGKGQAEAEGMSASEIRRSLSVMLAEETGTEATSLQDTLTTGIATTASISTSMGAVAAPWPATDEEVTAIMDALAPLGLWHPVPSKLLRRSNQSTDANDGSASAEPRTRCPSTSMTVADRSQEAATEEIDRVQRQQAPGFERRWRHSSVEDAQASIRECWSSLLEGPPQADCSWPWCAPQLPVRLGVRASSSDRSNSAALDSSIGMPPQWGEGIIFGLVPNLSQFKM